MEEVEIEGPRITISLGMDLSHARRPLLGSEANAFPLALRGCPNQNIRVGGQV